MRKIVIIVSITLVFFLSSCSLFLNDFQEAMLNMATAKSITMEMEINDISFLSQVSIQMKLEDGKTDINILGQHIYGFVEGDTEYILIEFGGEMIAVDTELYSTENDYVEGFFKDFDTLNSKNFILEDDGYYHAEKKIDELEDLRIKISEGYITEMLFQLNVEGVKVDCEINIFGYNNTEVDLPEYKMPSSYEETQMKLWVLYGLSYSNVNNGFLYTSRNYSIFYNENNDEYIISRIGSEISLIFDPVEDILFVEETPNEYGDYENSYIEEEVIELLKELYNNKD